MTRPTVLIADDDRHVRQALRILLNADGYEVAECADGLGVIARIRSQPVDAIILDHEMPLGDGRAVAETIRTCSNAPIIFLSGHAPDEFRDTVLRLAETYYLAKPPDPVRLRALLGSALAAPA
jgi:two-component system, OmpR family, response regulator